MAISKFLKKFFNQNSLQLLFDKNLSPYSLIALLSLTIFSLYFFLGHYSGILIDFGREVYYPEQILEGKVLYKDLFNIYGPLSYQINAVLYKIFGIKLSTLYFAGSLCSFGIVCLIYLISRKFLSEFLSFCIAIFTISAGIATTSIFNFHFPYSWAMVYGLIAFLFSLYFLINYISSHNNLPSQGKELYFSAFFAGISIACKYDFLLYVFIVLFFIIKNKNWKAFLCFISVPIFSYGILFMQGLNLSDLMNSLVITNKMAHTKTLTYFYQNSGVYFSLPVIPHDIFSFLFFSIPFSGVMFSYKFFQKENYFIKILSVVLFSVSLFFLYVLLGIKANYIFDFILVFILVFSLSTFKKINSILAVLTVSTILAGAKIFWAVFIGSYGTFYISLALICAFALLFNILPKKYEKIAGIIILFISLFFFSIHFKELSGQMIETGRGKISTELFQSVNTNNLIEYINKNTKPYEKILILPEGMIINFLTNRKSDDFYNSFLPLYTETFAEKEIIEHFNSDKPDYIVLSNLNMKDYYYKYICEDYARDFCAFILDNYNQVDVIDKNSEYGYLRYIIFKIK